LIVSVMQETAQGIRIVKAFNLSRSRRMNEAIEAVRKALQQDERHQCPQRTLVESLANGRRRRDAVGGLRCNLPHQQPGVFTSF
jgi:hypothetical protein